VQNEPIYIEASLILVSTNGGLDIIHDLYPASIGCELDRKKKFKIREEKSPSANLYQGDDKNWLVTDFGGDQKPRNGIGCYMEENRVDYVTALRELAVKYGIIEGKMPEDHNTAAYSEKEAGPNDLTGNWSWEVREGGLTDLEVNTIVSTNVLASLKWKFRFEEEVDKAVRNFINKKFAYYRWHPLKSYSLVKDARVLTFSATDRYPIFLFDEGTHQKLYQPLHPDKSKRFMYIGNKPKDFIHGLFQLKNEFETKKKNADGEKNATAENYDRTGVSDEDEEKEVRLNEAILCSGGSDAINVALIGYQVLWLNSETAKLQEWQYKEIMNMVVKFYQLDDIDTAGKAASHAKAMDYLDLFTIELPEELKKHRDKRRNPCKDLRDFLNHYPAKDFHILVDIALPYRFWEKKPKFDGKGEDRIQVGYAYTYDNVQANNFLMKNGFGRLMTGDKKTEWIYVQRIDNIVREVDADIIQDFLHTFLEVRRFDKDLRNAMLQTSRLNDSSLTRLKILDIEFEDYTRDSQFFFFQNKTVEVTEDKITFHKPGNVNRYIWQEDLYKHRIEEIKEEPFTITYDKDLDSYDIKVHNYDCLFFKYLVQTSRVHWRTEFETGEKILAMTGAEQLEYIKNHHCIIDGPNLSEEEIEEQKQHLINKIFSIGFLLHHYHDRTKGWFVWGMDNKINDDGKSHGGSGKSILFDVAMRIMLPKNFSINGRNTKLTENEHKYDGLTEHHRYVLIDDSHEYLKLDAFYTDITGDIQVNPKGKKLYSIPFEKAPKFAITSNFTPRDIGPSTDRRMIYSVFSDWYHNKGEGSDYREFRDPKTDLGVQLFVDFDTKQWNQFYNTMMFCNKFFLGTTKKINPAMQNVTKRNLLAQMGQAFNDWAYGYFSPEGDRLDKFFVREEAYKCFNTVNKGEITAQAFRDKMRSFCQFNHYRLNPKGYQDKNGKIIKKVEAKIHRKETNSWELIPGAVKETKEVWFIQTRDELPADPMIGWPVQEGAYITHYNLDGSIASSGPVEQPWKDKPSPF
jgi:hypothetical protein